MKLVLLWGRSPDTVPSQLSYTPIADFNVLESTDF